MLSKNVLYYGKDRPLPEKVPLRAGPLSLVYQDGDLRYIRLGDKEILRRIYVAVRDANWGTVPAVLSNLSVKTSGRRFEISYVVENKQREIHFCWTAKITGDESGTITFLMEGKALTTFLRNRIGFCVHHPIRECAGHPCTAEKVDGSIQQGVFPLHVSPHQPFLDIQAISHEVMPGVVAEVRFSGYTFEMEDHRNWTDASYKTYCTPLRLPFPVEVKAGAEITQSVRLSLHGKVSEMAATTGGDTVTFSFGDGPRVPLPALGLGVASHGGPLSTKEISRLKALNLSHLRLDLVLSHVDYPAALQRGASEANSLGVPLEIAFTLSDSASEELADLAARLKELRPRVCRWLIFHAREKSTDAKWVVLSQKYLAAYDAAAKFVSGTNANFAELNRGRPDTTMVDGACFSVNPQMHAFDKDSLVENLAAQASVIESARQFLDAVPVIVSPVTLKRRFSPDATGPEPPPDPGELPSQVDVRQTSLFGAAWTAGSLKYLSEGGAASVTYYETTGWRGVMETENGSPLPERFRSIPGAVFPLYHVLAGAGEFAGGVVVVSRSSEPLLVDGIVLRKGDRTRILLANFGPEVRQIRMSTALLGPRVHLKRLDETNVEHAMKSPEAFRAEAGQPLEITGHWLEISLHPFAVVRLEGINKEGV